jgi:hypothetical protein
MVHIRKFGHHFLYVSKIHQHRNHNLEL